MPNVVRFALSTAKTLHVPGAGTFIAGILDVDANNLALLTKTRYLVQPYRAVELGTVDAATPKPTLPAVPGPPAPDPYPQYLTAAEAASSPELRAQFAPIGGLGGSLRLAALGDSITKGSSDQSVNSYGASPLFYAALLSDGRIQHDRNAGVSGETTAQIAARVGDITNLSPKPDACLVMGGTNDTTAPGGVQDAKSVALAAAANLTTIITALRAAGIEPVLCTLPPSSIGNANTDLRIATINAWMHRYAALNRMRLVDFYPLLVNPAGLGFKSGLQTDVTHPNSIGYKAMGQAIVDTLTPAGGIKPARAWLPASNIDPTNLITNGLMQNGTVLPTGWATAAAGTGFTDSVVADTAFRGGKAYQCARTDVSSHVISQDLTKNTAFSEGDRLAISYKITTTGIEGTGATADVAAIFGNATGAPANLAWARHIIDLTAAVFYAEAVVPPMGSTLQVQIRSNGGTAPNYSFRVGEFAVRNLTRLGIA